VIPSANNKSNIILETCNDIENFHPYTKKGNNILKQTTVINLVIDEHRISQLEKKLEGLNLLERKFGDLARQLMLTELAMGEKARTEYDSGIKQIRSTNDGTKSYFQPTHTE
jgi:hypothetical protein